MTNSSEQSGSASSSLGDGTIRVQDGNAVVIGGPTAPASLDVYGGAVVRGNLTAGYLFGNGALLTGVSTSDIDASKITSGVLASARVFGNVSDGNIRVVNGNVGIGNAAPLHRLSVAGDAFVAANLAAAGFLTGALEANTVLVGRLALGNLLSLYGTGDAHHGFGLDNSTLTYRVPTTGHRHAFYASGTLAANVDAQGIFTPLALRANTASLAGTGTSLTTAGSVGVGLGAPAERLHVAGNLLANVVSANAATLTGTATSLTTAGSVGIGTVAPTERLHVVGNVLASFVTANGSLLTSLNANAVTTGTLNAARLPANLAINDLLVVNSLVGDGSLLTFDQLGVGTATPAQKLDVVGNAVVRGVLVTDGNLGIANAAPLHRLSVTGNAFVSGAVEAANVLVIGRSALGNLLSVSGADALHQGLGAEASTLTYRVPGALDRHAFYASATLAANVDAQGIFTPLALRANTASLAGTGTSLTTAGSVGIGTVAPAERLHVVGNVLANFVTANGSLLTSLNANAIATGTINSARLPANITVTDAVVLNALVGDGSLLTFNSLGIGTQEPTANLYVVGNAAVTGTLVQGVSDQRLKTDIRRIDAPLERVAQLKGVFFNFNDLAASYGFAGGEQVGVLAQDVQAALPQAVLPAPFDADAYRGSASGQFYKTVQYEKLTPLLVEAVHALAARVDALTAALAALTARVDALAG